MLARLLQRLSRTSMHVRSCFRKQTLEQGRSALHPHLAVVVLNGRMRLDGPTVNYSFGTLHRILAAALEKVDIGSRAPRSVLVLGLGAGSVVELLRRVHHARAPIVGVEVDGEVLRLGREHFGLARWAGLEIVQADAQAFLAADARRFEFVLVDLFVDAVVPAPFRGRPFLQLLARRLAPGGLLLFNMIADAPGRRDEAARLESELRGLFGSVEALPIHSNVVFAARDGLGGAV